MRIKKLGQILQLNKIMCNFLNAFSELIFLRKHFFFAQLHLLTKTFYEKIFYAKKRIKFQIYCNDVKKDKEIIIIERFIFFFQ